MSRIFRFLKNEDGPTAIEYAVMVAMIMLAIMTSVKLLQSRTGAVYDQCGVELNNAGF
jgi:pilus assembly protein Flp/PilA